MNPHRTSITPLGFSMLAIRLVALLMFFSSLSYVGYLLIALTEPAQWNEMIAGPYAAILLVYAIVFMIIIRYPGPIARILAKGIPRFVVESRWNRAELLAAIIAGVAVYVLLSGIPGLLNDIYNIATQYQDMVAAHVSEKTRLNHLVVGLIGSIIRIGLAAAVFAKSGRLATLWNRWQTAGGLKR